MRGMKNHQQTERHSQSPIGLQRCLWTIYRGFALIHFVKFDSLRNVRKIGEATDSMIDAGLTERRALQGLIIRDTIRCLFWKQYSINLSMLISCVHSVEYHGYI